jgi:hypothetical protein
MAITGHRRKPQDYGRIVLEMKQVFCLVYGDGLSYRQTAEVMGFSLGTVQKRLRQFRQAEQTGEWIPRCRCRFCWGGKSAELEGTPRGTRFIMGPGVTSDTDPSDRTLRRVTRTYYDGTADVILSDPAEVEMRKR